MKRSLINPEGTTFSSVAQFATPSGLVCCAAVRLQERRADCIEGPLHSANQRAANRAPETELSMRLGLL